MIDGFVALKTTSKRKQHAEVISPIMSQFQIEHPETFDAVISPYYQKCNQDNKDEGNNAQVAAALNSLFAMSVTSVKHKVRRSLSSVPASSP